MKRGDYMAGTICFDITTNSCSWAVYDLESTFTSNNYISAGIALGQANGTSSPPFGTIAKNYPPPPPGSTYGTGGTVTGLSPGTTYTFYGFAQSVNGNYYPAGSFTFTTEEEPPPDPPDPPYNISHSVTENSARITFTKGYGADSTEVEYKHGGQSNYTSVTTSSSSFNLEGLLYGTTYVYRLRSHGEGGSSSWTSLRYFTTEEDLPDRPSDFSWTYPKISGSNFKLTPTEWNSFTSRINAFREYKGFSPVSFTTAVNGNDFTAKMFNQARNAIAALSAYFTGGRTIPGEMVGISDVSNPIYANEIRASYLNALVDALNSIP